MTALILPRRFTQQPQGPVEINWGNPLTRELFSVSVPSNTLANVSITGTKLAPRANMLGRGFGGTLGVGTTDSFVLLNKTTYSAERTYFALVFQNSDGGGGFGRIHDKRTSSSQTDSWMCATAGRLTLERSHSGGTQKSEYVAKTIPALFSTAVVCPPAGTIPTAYIDGVAVADIGTGTPGSGTPTTTTDPYVLGNRTNDNARNWDGIIFIHAMWNRQLVAAEVKSLRENPWQLFKPRRQVLYFDVGGGTTTSATDPGAITVTGTAATSTRHLLSTTSPGAVTVTGVAATSARRLVSATSPGQITVTGTPATSLRALLSPTSPGAITVTGSAATSIRSLLSITSPGAITVTGVAATSTYTPVGTITSEASPGAITVTGVAATSTWAHLSATQPGQITVSGFAATSLKAIISATQPGVLTVTGFASYGTWDHLSGTTPGAITVTGYAATSTATGNISLTQADLDAIADAVWAKVLSGITAGNRLANLPAAVRAELAAELANMDAPVSDVPAEVLAAAQAAPIHADVRKMNDAQVTGTGTSGDKWRGV